MKTKNLINHIAKRARIESWCVRKLVSLDARRLLEQARPAFVRLRLEAIRLGRLREWRAAAALYARYQAPQRNSPAS